MLFRSIYRDGKDERGFRRFLNPAMRPLSLTPSEYFRRNFYVGASLFLPSEAQRRHEIGVGTIMWGVDYPHSEGTFPYSRQAISLTFSDVPPAEVADMLGLTAAKVFNFDVDQLQRLADGVGPTVAEVRTPPSSIPQIPADTLSPVFAAGLFSADR